MCLWIETVVSIWKLVYGVCVCVCVCVRTANAHGHGREQEGQCLGLTSVFHH